jgi:hypothetical protein
MPGLTARSRDIPQLFGNKRKTGTKIPRIPALSAAHVRIQLFPRHHTLEPSPPVGKLSFDYPLKRCWMEHLNSGIARFAPVFFNRPFTAADENLPLSMVRVKNKPQHLVFCSHFAHQLFKHRHLPVETSNQPCPARVCTLKSALNPAHRQGRPKPPSPYSSTLAPDWSRTQDAEPVHFPGSSVQVVDNRAGRGHPCLRTQSAAWPEASAGAEPARSVFRLRSGGRKQRAFQPQTAANPRELSRMAFR